MVRNLHYVRDIIKTVFINRFGKYPGNTDNDNGMIQTCWSDGNSPFGMFPTL